MGKINSIQLIRVFGAISIVLYHSTIIGNHGYFGVEIFNVISGFLLVYTTENIKTISAWKLLIKRLIRICPLYWLWTLVMDVILWIFPWMSSTTEHGFGYLLKSILFIPYTNSRGYNLPIVGVGWTLGYEICFYIVFIISMKINHKYRGLITSCLLVALVGTNYLINLWGGNDVTSYYSSSVLIEFIYGIAIYYFYNKIVYWEKSYMLVSCILWMASMLVLILDLGWELEIPRGIRIGIPAAVFFASSILILRNVKIPQQLIGLGNMTYSIYLSEHFTTGVYRALFVSSAFAIQLCGIVGLFAVTYLISFVSYIIVEQRLGNWLKEKLL